MLLFLAIPLSLELIALTMGARLLFKTDKNMESVGKFCRLVGYIVVSVALFSLVLTVITSLRISLIYPYYAKANMMRYYSNNNQMMNVKTIKAKTGTRKGR